MGKQTLPGSQSSCCCGESGENRVHTLSALSVPFDKQATVPSPAMEHLSEQLQFPTWQTGSQGAPLGISPGPVHRLVVSGHELASFFEALLTGEN
jgi:hypothetical protein